MRTLYLCYFGLREPLVQTQVLPYLRKISSGGIEVSLLTFEPSQRRMWPPEDMQQWRVRLRADGIRWFSLPYHKRPSLPATLYDIAAGGWMASRVVRRYGRVWYGSEKQRIPHRSSRDQTAECAGHLLLR